MRNQFLIGLVLGCCFFSCKRSSNEVLEAFQTINERLEEANNNALINIDSVLLKQPQLSKKYAKKVKETQVTFQELDTYIAILKNEMLKNISDSLNYEAMDTSLPVDRLFFENGRLSHRGIAFVEKIENYKRIVSKNFENDFPGVVKKMKLNFSTDSIVIRGSKKVNWLQYNFEGFPLIASITRCTQLQNDLKSHQSTLLLAVLSSAND